MMIQVTMDELKAAFTEWDRRYRENSDKFMTESRRLAEGTPKTYGDGCGPYFRSIIDDLRIAKGHATHLSDEDVPVASPPNSAKA